MVLKAKETNARLLLEEIRWEDCKPLADGTAISFFTGGSGWDFTILEGHRLCSEFYEQEMGVLGEHYFHYTFLEKNGQPGVQ